MDPISQGVIGAALAMVPAQKQELKASFLVGWLAGMAPDLDVFIRSSSDPLLAIEYHRHFTHSLLMAPIIGLVVAILLHFLTLNWKSRLNVTLGRFILFGVLGAFTHGLLDACTSYGTQLLWPFSNMRVAWNNVGIVDPIPTFGTLALIVLAVRKQSSKWAFAGISFYICYLLFGVVQRERAEKVLQEIASRRGHSELKRASTKPTIFNLIVFRSVYEFEDKYYIDAIRVPLFGKNEFLTGDNVPVFQWKNVWSGIPETSPQRFDLERFAWFSDNFLTKMPDGLISDARYSMAPESAAPMWGIYLNANKPQEHVKYWAGREISADVLKKFFGSLFFGKQNQ
jgi:inner membrane protein